MRFPFIIIFALLLSGCMSSKGLRAKPGTVSGETSTGTKGNLTQPENPKDGARSSVKSTKTEKTVTPGGTITKEQIVTSRDLPDGTKETVTKTNTIIIPEGKELIVENRIDETIDNSVGGAQKDTVGETVAKLKSANAFYYIGGALIVLGLACAFIPYLKAILGSTQFGLFLALGGAGIMMLPLIVVGNETMIIILVAAIAGPFLYLHFHRHGQAQGKAEAYAEFIDKNKNGVDDRLEKT